MKRPLSPLLVSAFIGSLLCVACAGDKSLPITPEGILADLRSPRVKQVVIDSDTYNEMDDQYAIAYALASEKMEVLSLHAAPFFNNRSTSFEEGMELSFKEMQRVLAIVGRQGEIPVFEGARRRISDDPESFDPEGWTRIPPFLGSDTEQIWRETKDGVDELLARYGYRKDGPVWKTAESSMDTIALFCHFGIIMAVLGYLTDISPMILWHRTICLPSSVTEVVTEERIPGEAFFRIVKAGDLAHLEMNGHPRSTHGLYPERYTGVDSTDPRVNGMPQRKDP